MNIHNKWTVSILLAASVVVLSGCKSMLKTERESNWARTKEKGTYYYLPKAVVKVTGVWDGTTGLWDLTATPVYGADTNAGVFMVKRHEVVVFDDNWSVSVDPNTGLLLSINGSSTDQTVNSLASLAAAAAAFAGLPTAVGNISGAIKAFTMPAGMTDDQKIFWDAVNRSKFNSFQTYLDPDTNGYATKSVYVMSPMANGQVTYMRYDLTLNRSAIANLAGADSLSAPDGKTDDDGKDFKFNGVLVRDAVPFSLGISGNVWFTHWSPRPDAPTNLFLIQTGATQPGQQLLPLQNAWTYNLSDIRHYFANDFPDSDWKPRQFVALQQTLNLPDVNHTRLVKISRRPLVQDSTTLTLANGMITSQQQVRPSIVMGILGIPKTLITAIVPLPGGGGGGSSSGGTSGAGSGSGGSGASSSGGSQNGSQSQPSSGQFAPIQ